MLLGMLATASCQLAFDEPSVLHSRTIGESWFAVAGRIMASGLPSLYDGLPIRELSLVTLAVERPDPDDEIIATARRPRAACLDARQLHRSRASGEPR